MNINYETRVVIFSKNENASDFLEYQLNTSCAIRVTTKFKHSENKPRVFKQRKTVRINNGKTYSSVTLTRAHIALCRYSINQYCRSLSFLLSDVFYKECENLL